MKRTRVEIDPLVGKKAQGCSYGGNVVATVDGLGDVMAGCCAPTASTDWSWSTTASSRGRPPIGAAPPTEEDGYARGITSTAAEPRV